MDIIVGMTNCEKKQVDYESVDDCEFQDGVVSSSFLAYEASFRVSVIVIINRFQ